MFNIIVLGFTSLLTDISSEMVYPLIPFFLTATLGAGPAVLGIVEGIAESTASLLKVFSGYISDRLKKRKALTIAGYASSMLGKAMLCWAGSWGVVLGARVIDRIGKGIRTAPRDALIAESVEEGKRGRAFGLHRAMDTTGAAIGVLLAYAILSAKPGSYSGVFLWSVVPAAAGVFLLYHLRESKPPTKLSPLLPLFRWNVLPRKLQLFLIIAFVFTLGNSSNTFLLLRASGLGFTPPDAILLYLVYNVSYALFSYPAGKLFDRIGPKSLLTVGYLVYGCAYLGFAVCRPETGSGVVWGLFGLYGLYSGLTDGIEKALVSNLAPAGLRATAIGLHATIVGIGLLPASLLAGELWALLGPEATFFFGSALGLLAAAGLAFIL
jgi:MFS family permease